MNIIEAQERLEKEISVKRRALQYLEDHADDFEEGEEINMNELYRSIQEQDEYNMMIAEENSLRYAWQQDLIDMYRFER